MTAGPADTVRARVPAAALSPHHPMPDPARTVPQPMYFEAPEYYRPQPADPPAVFLAGGITGCSDWQAEAVKLLESDTEPLVILNPNREKFPSGDHLAAWEQVSWEQHHLHLADVTAFWFPASDPSVTVQPIAMFELGQALGENRPVVVGADPGYPREADVHMLCELARPGMPVYSYLEHVVHDVLTVTCAMR